MSADELRTLLREHAEVTDTTGPGARVQAVHGRVRSVRRRRRAIVASAVVVAVVAAGASVVPTLRRPAPGPTDAPAVLAGRTVPRTQTAAGYTYEYVRGVQSKPGAEELRLTVTAETAPKLVMWATSSTKRAPVVRLTSNVGEHLRSAAGGFERFMLLSPGGSERLTLTQRHAPSRNRLALAVYTLDDTPPPGVSNGVVTFRRTILDNRLVAGLIGKPGQTDLRTTIDPLRGPIRISDLCYGAGIQDYVHVSFNGKDVGGSSCARQPVFDPGVDGASFTAAQNPLPVRGPVHVHLWLTGKDGSAASADAHVVIGFGLYEMGGVTFRLAGQSIPVRQESDGYEYVHTRSLQSRPGQRSVTVTVPPSDVPRLVTTADSGDEGGFALTELVVDDQEQSRFEDATGGGGGWSSGYVIQPGESPTLTFRMARGKAARTVLGIALSDQVH